MTAAAGAGLLVAAHGDRRGEGRHEALARLVAELAARGLADEVAFGLIKGTPAIGDALDALAAREVLVYPLFLADGYFVRTALPRLLQRPDGSRRSVTVLPPLGLDPALGTVIAARASERLQAYGCSPGEATLVLLAHGSSRDRAPRRAAESLADVARAGGRFAAVRVAFLEEPPSLPDVAARTPGRMAVVGLFAGEGLHGGQDVPRLLSGLGRDDVVFAGHVASFPELPDLIEDAVRDWIRSAADRPVGRPAAAPQRQRRAR